MPTDGDRPSYSLVEHGLSLVLAVDVGAVAVAVLDLDTVGGGLVRLSNASSFHPVIPAALACVRTWPWMSVLCQSSSLIANEVGPACRKARDILKALFVGLFRRFGLSTPEGDAAR